MFCSGLVTIKSQTNVLVQSVKIYNYSYTKRRKKKDSSSYRDCKLFLSKDGFEVVRVDCSIASIPSFRVDILLSSESTWFDAKMAKMEPNDKIELREILGLLYLPLSQHLSSKKILKVFMICNNINGIG